MSIAEVAQLLGGPKILGRSISSQLKMADAVDRGLPTDSLNRVKMVLGLSDVEVAHALGISLKTILLSAFFEDGPVRYEPEGPPADKHESEDPNSNPHYIWDEQGRDQEK